MVQRYSPHSNCRYNLLCAEGTHRSSISKRAGNTSTPGFLSWDHKSAAEEVAIAAGQMLHADYVESGTHPIIMANEFGGVIFHEACGHLLETTQIERKTLREKKGEKLPTKVWTAWDEGLFQLPRDN